jgi:hypothetical protein
MTKWLHKSLEIKYTCMFQYKVIIKRDRLHVLILITIMLWEATSNDIVLEDIKSIAH